MVWDIVGLLQGSKRPLPRKPRKKSEKGVRGASRPRGQKKTRKEAGFRLFFGLFQPRGREAPKTPFQLFSGFSRERGLSDPCRRPTMSQILVDVSDFFSARERGRGSPRHREGGGSVFIGPWERGREALGAGRLFAGNRKGGGKFC